MYFSALRTISIALLLNLANFCKGASILLPPPKGPYGTTITTAELIDTTRLDPYSSTNQSRSLMISVFTPVPAKACKNLTSTPYMPPQTAQYHNAMYEPLGIPAGTFESIGLQICSNINTKTKLKSPSNYPVVIFSPGLGNSRHIYNAIAQSVASNGYIVISIDHPHDASVVEFPDGTTITATDIETDDEIAFSVSVRSKDVSFVLDSLSRPSNVIPCLKGSGLDVHKVGIFGHSLGGATALASMTEDRRIAGGINLDGSFFGPAITTGTNRPFLIVGHEGKNRSTDPSWAATWSNLKGWKAELEVLKASHGSFTDLPVLVHALGLEGSLPDEVTMLLGSLGGERVLEIVRVWVGMFFDFVLKGRNKKAFKERKAEFPEVVVLED